MISNIIIYVKPSAERKNDDLIVFEFTEDSEVDSSISSKMPTEAYPYPTLLIGLKVEITYHYDGRSLSTYKIKSIKPADSHSPVGDKFYYSLNLSNDGGIMDGLYSNPSGVVAYVAKINIPIKAYVLYIDTSDMYFPVYIFESTEISDNLRELIENGEVGYSVKATITYPSLFEGCEFGRAVSVELYW